MEMNEDQASLPRNVENNQILHQDHSIDFLNRLKEDFHRAVEIVKTKPITNEQSLELYSLYKQATSGPLKENKVKMPSVFDVVGRAKYYAWRACNDMSKTEAMEKYINLVKQIAPERFHINYNGSQRGKHLYDKIKREIRWTQDASLLEGTMNMKDLPKEQQIDLSAVTRYMIDNVPEFCGQIVQLRPFVHSQSNPTFYVRSANDHEYVLRKKPRMNQPKGTMPINVDLSNAIEREYRIMRVLHEHTNIPVPKVRCLCLDSSIVGTPFYVMDFVRGRIFHDRALRDVKTENERFAIYEAHIDMVARLHNLDYKKLGLSDFGRLQSDNVANQSLLFCERQIDKLQRQYAALKQVSESFVIPDMERLLNWLTQRIVELKKEDTKEDVHIIHGDLELSNFIFDEKEPKIIAVLDWEFSTLGSSLYDLAYACLAYHTTPEYWPLRGLHGLNLTKLGIPSEREFLNAYCRRTGRGPIKMWNFYIALAFAKGIYRVQLLQYNIMLSGQPTYNPDRPSFVPYYMRSEKSLSVSARIGAALAWKKVSSDTMPASTPTPLSRLLEREYLLSRLPVIDLRKESFIQFYMRIWQFMNEYVFPNEHIYELQLREDKRRVPLVLEQLQSKARELNLYNFWLHHVRAKRSNSSSFVTIRKKNDESVGSIDTVEFALLMEVAGRSNLAMETFNCQPWDVSVMMTLRGFGTERQRVELLQSMMEGRNKLCVTMQDRKSDLSFTPITSDKNYEDVEAVKGNSAEDIRYQANGKVYALTPINTRHQFLLVPRTLRTYALLSINSPSVSIQGDCIELQNALVNDEIHSPNMLVLEFSWCCRLLAQCDEILREYCKEVKIRSLDVRMHYTDIARIRIKVDSTRLLLMSAANDIDRMSSEGEEGEVLRRNLDVMKLEVVRVCQHMTKASIKLGLQEPFREELERFERWFVSEGGLREIDNISSLELLRANL